MYLVFTYNDYAPKGGYHDLTCVCKSLKDAHKHALNSEYNCYQIVYDDFMVETNDKIGENKKDA